MRAQKTAPIPVRLKKSVAKRVASAAVQLGVPRSVVIRWSITAYLPKIESGEINFTGKEAA